MTLRRGQVVGLVCALAGLTCRRDSSPRQLRPPVVAAPVVPSPKADVAVEAPPALGPTEAEAPPRPTAPPGEASSEPARAVDLVTIKVLATPPKTAHVFWGVKDLGVAPLELHRPRGSGPMDLVLRAPGFLTHHTRVFTDRDDTLTIRLSPENEAARYFGYQAPPEKTAPASKAKPGARPAR